MFCQRRGDRYNECAYDDLDRLTGVTYHDLDIRAFGMDELGSIGPEKVPDTVNLPGPVKVLLKRFLGAEQALQ